MGKISKLYKKEDWYRPLFVRLENGNEIQLDGIVVYDENGIVLKNDYGYFDNNMEIEIKEGIKRKIKENYKQKENYVLRTKKDYSNDIVYKLYIYRDNVVNLQFLGFEKMADLILAKYNINGGEFKTLYTTISGNKYEYIDKFKELRNSIKEYMNEEKLNAICKELIEINKKMIEDEKRIKDFKIQSMEGEAQKIVNRLIVK